MRLVLQLSVPCASEQQFRCRRQTWPWRRVALLRLPDLVLTMGLALAGQARSLSFAEEQLGLTRAPSISDAQLILRAWLVTMAMLSIILLGFRCISPLVCSATLLAVAFGLLSAAVFNNGDKVERRALWAYLRSRSQWRWLSLRSTTLRRSTLLCFLGRSSRSLSRHPRCWRRDFSGWPGGGAPRAIRGWLASIGVLLNEQIVSRAYFSRYHYGNATTITHAGPVDTILAHYASDWPGTTLIVSDPATAANLGAQVGLDSVSGFSNLDTMLADRRRAYRRFCGTSRLAPSLTGPYAGNSLCSFPGQRTMFTSPNPAEMAPRLCRIWDTGSRFGPSMLARFIDADEFLAHASDNRYNYNIVIVVTRRTLDWTAGKAFNPYSATTAPLPDEVMARLQRLGAVTSGSQAAMLHLECSSNEVARSEVAGTDQN